MNQQVLTLTPGGRPLAASLGFEASTVLVDNYTSSYVRIPDAGKDIPPWVYGAVVALPPGIRQAVASLIATVPAVAGPAVPVSQATLTWTDRPLPADPGHLLQQSQYSKRIKLYPDGVTPSSSTAPSFTVAAGGTATPRFTLPDGTSQIRILATANGLLFTYSLLVLGHQTSEQYFGDTGAPGSPAAVPSPTLPFTIAVENDWDFQLDFSVIGDGTNPTTYYVSAILAPEAPGQAGSAQSVISPTPAPWQAGNQRATVPATSVAGGGGTLTLIAAVGTSVIRPTHYEFFQDGANAAGAFTLQDLGGTAIHPMFCNATRGLLARGNLEGIGLGAGAGLRVQNLGAAASFFGGVIDYSRTST